MMSQRNLGTIRARKSAKRAMNQAAGNSTEMIMRILRMRYVEAWILTLPSSSQTSIISIQ